MLIKISAPGLQDFLRYSKTIPLDDRNLPFSKERLEEFFTKEASCWIAVEIDIFDNLPREIQKVFIQNTQDILKVFMYNLVATANLDILQLKKNNELKISFVDFLYQQLLEAYKKSHSLSKDILKERRTNE